MQRFEPPVFFIFLFTRLRLLVVTQSAGFSSSAGHFIADQLTPFIQRVNRLLGAAKGQGWSAEDIAGVRFILGNALMTLGEQSGKNEQLHEAVAAYRATLQEYTRERVPLDWAATQNSLGVALADLAERESGTEHLQQAIAAFRAALQERTREKVPLEWAATQNNLGNALLALGERESGTEHLQQAIAAHRAALLEFTRARVPLDWAMTQSNLGAALHALGERESGTEHLQQALAAYRAALLEYTRKRVPLDWALLVKVAHAFPFLSPTDCPTFTVLPGKATTLGVLHTSVAVKSGLKHIVY